MRLVREQVVRFVGFLYLAVHCFGMTPAVLQSASTAQIHALPFLARYSNTSTLVTCSLAFMVRSCQSSLEGFLLHGQQRAYLCAGLEFCGQFLCQKILSVGPSGVAACCCCMGNKELISVQNSNFVDDSSVATRFLMHSVLRVRLFLG